MKAKKNVQPGRETNPIAADGTEDKADTVPTPPDSPERVIDPFPIVGIGASAGGLAAFEAFFSGLATAVEPGMAFVLVQHLSPDHRSILSDLVRRYTRMAVFEVTDGMAVQPDCAYIIPPGYDMALLKGKLNLFEPCEPRGQRLPIDFFFRSLAQDQRRQAIGIILSGTGCDGTQGVRAIKDQGGIVLVQRPDSTEFDGMSRSAIATGLVDAELLPAEMPAHLIAHVAQSFGKLPPRGTVSLPMAESAMSKIFILLRAQTGHDFSHYKLNTIKRRIERRMAVHQIETVERYVKYLQQAPVEVEELFRDLLIGVTSFFRDPEAFKVLESQVIPGLFSGKASSDAVRVWAVGCSTGEEAYSIAILLAERMEEIKKNHTVQIFATDIDRRAIATARAGVYPASISENISPQRLERFFLVEADGTYRIHKRIRDLVVFSEHDVLKDPPFSRLDLIICRNLLIYLETEAQKKIISLFGYALRSGGALFLGSSSTVGELGEALFTVIDRGARLFQRKQDNLGARRAASWRMNLPMRAMDASAREGEKREDFVRKSLRELTEQKLLQHVAPAAALVNQRGDILYLHGRTGMFLEPMSGEPGINNILEMAREGLRRELILALHEAAATRGRVDRAGVRIGHNGDFARARLTIYPVPPGPASGSLQEVLYAVILEESSAIGAEPAQPVAKSAITGAPRPSAYETQIATLTQEVQAKDEYLQTVLQQLAISAKDLQSSNEEMQSVNEELQSTNEELETSKEELQSVNEELTTINTELQNKVADLSRANNDMSNLLAGTGIGTLFVDHQLRIMRFTPAVTATMNLIPGDVGRPLSHVVSNLAGYGQLVADVQSVLDTLVPRQVEVATPEGKFYSMRIQPYRTIENVIEGAVISFIEITEIVAARKAIRKANEELRLAAVVRDTRDAIIVQDIRGQILAWNPAATALYGWSEAEALAMNDCDRIPPRLREEASLVITRLLRDEIVDPYRTRRIDKRGHEIEVTILSSVLTNEEGQIYALASTERPIDRGTQ